MLHEMVETVYSHEVGSKGVINLHPTRGKLHSAKHDTKNINASRDNRLIGT